ncbi:FGGY family carbohydrate kinase, partial [Yersinia pestis]|uniref:FGGY family carbohydrate kinase n=1 Tax=Yersinia pestis TaxID=632 RepID=UPI00211514DF
WGVDFVLLDKQWKRIGQPVSYRDSRKQGVMARAQQTLGSNEIYRRTGIQFLPFNTLYQLLALSEQQPHLLADVAHLL